MLVNKTGDDYSIIRVQAVPCVGKGSLPETRTPIPRGAFIPPSILNIRVYNLPKVNSITYHYGGWFEINSYTLPQQ